MERKLYPCKECGKKVPIRSKGLCNSCRYKQREKEGTLPSYSKKIKPFKVKNRTTRKEGRKCLDIFFKHHTETLQKNPVSMESGTFISTVTTANLAHILPKRKTGGFPSVQCHLDNCVYLTIQEHNRFDKLLDERDYSKIEQEFPNTWKIVCQRLPKLLDMVTERNKMYFSLTEYLT